MSAAQLSFDVLPVADPDFEREQLREARLAHVLARARAMETSDRLDIGRWWLGQQLAEYIGEPVAKVSLDMHCLRERGALYRERGGVGPDGRTVWLWATTQGQP